MKKDKMLYALITVLITVPSFVFYCLALESDGLLNVSISKALLLIPIELLIAYPSALFIGSPLAHKIALKKADPKKTDKTIFETILVCSTVCIMCPWMSFLATILYNGIFPGLIYHETSFSIYKFFIEFIPSYLQTVAFNFPFALLTQVFFIQPLVRSIFGKLKETELA